MDNFRVHYSGACFERGDSLEQVERRVQDRIAFLGEMLGIEATFLHPDQRDLGGENYVVGFEGEIEVEAETKELAENQAYGQPIIPFGADNGSGIQKRRRIGGARTTC